MRKETFFQLVSIEGVYSHVFEISIEKNKLWLIIVHNVSIYMKKKRLEKFLSVVFLNCPNDLSKN